MKHIINTENAPAPIGPYSQAVKSGHLLYTSGQIPIDPATGDMVEGGIREQSIQVLENLKAVLEAAGATLDDAIKTTVFLADMGDFPELNTIYAEYFGEDNAPARSTIQVAALPKGALVEIELVAKV
ncbi:2-iminobutanoate/2-iminopropanoate deaminase [Pontiella desulfatans]|uniref:2-iminobutanoate/2-iminopropanoate deaminase n=1 Tax=Pontiella desulfatans TaxID=2750659 RepID=A0A6C2TYY2_PONDE|nr:RidA family protein [Pontiella desulfatans]VGO12862.1 2-iminobutanoate/2-iminopropanoate deaminase [Pontiella desulfatans]